MRSELDLIRQRLENMEQDNSGLRVRLETAETAMRRERRRMRRQSGLALVAVIGAMFVSPANRQAFAQVYGVTLVTLSNDVTALKTRTTAVEGRATTLETRATALETRATAVEAKNTQQDTTLANLQTQITNNQVKYKSFVVQADGTTPGVSGVTVSHVSGSGVYDITILAGYFPSRYTTPILASMFNGPRITYQLISSDGSLTFTVTAPGEQFFNVVIFPFQ